MAEMKSVQIMSNRIVRGRQFALKVALAVAGMSALAMPIVVGILNTPSIRAQSTPAPLKFEVASIKLCRPGDTPPDGGRKGGGGGASGNDPGRLSLGCQSLEHLIQSAYIRFGDGKARSIGSPSVSPRQMNQSIEGGPGWVTSDRYRIDAKPESPQTPEMMRGPMLQTLLEDRFKLKVRRETRDVPIYALVVAKGGPKLQPTKGCTPLDFTNGMPPRPAPGQPPPCGLFGPDTNGGMVTFGQTLAGVCIQFSVALDRNVVDRTGIVGEFDMHLDLSWDELFPSDRPNGVPGSDAAAPGPRDPLSAFTAAVQKLGLRLEPSKAPSEFLVIDHVERPSEN
jgi:uncharacterized protein (TIGR03435 family)